MISTRRSQKKICSVPLALTWSHAGEMHRVTAWPEARFEKLYGEDWIEVSPSAEALASSAQPRLALDWRVYLEFVPTEVRAFLERFRVTRMEALQVIARCPTLLEELTETPALAAFLAAHTVLRGNESPAWDEITAVHERNGLYGLLEWLGLPASRQTFAILHNIAEPDVPKRLLEPLRSLLWEPRAIFALQRLPAITDQVLARTCHALAA